MSGQLAKSIPAHFADVFAAEPAQFVDVESGVVPVDLREIEALDDFRERHFFSVVFRRPTQEAKVIDHRFRHISLVDVGLKRGPAVARAHFCAVWIEDQWNM